MMTPTSAGILQGIQNQLQQDVEKAKQDIEANVGAVLTEMNAKLREVDTSLNNLTEAGKAIIEKIEKEKAESVTQLQGFVGEAASEFGKHRGAIEKVATEVHDTQKTFLQ